MRAETFIRASLGAASVALAVSAITLAVNLSRLREYAGHIETVEQAAASGWRTDEPPMSEPIVGIWDDIEGIRSHVVVMVYGAAYPYDPTSIALQAIEYNRPAKWQAVP